MTRAERWQGVPGSLAFPISCCACSVNRHTSGLLRAIPTSRGGIPRCARCSAPTRCSPPRCHSPTLSKPTSLCLIPALIQVQVEDPGAQGAQRRQGVSAHGAETEDGDGVAPRPGAQGWSATGGQAAGDAIHLLVPGTHAARLRVYGQWLDFRAAWRPCCRWSWPFG